MHAEVLQITDLHLMCGRDMIKRGVPTRHALIEVLQFIHAGVQSGRWSFDCVVITGDLAEDEELATYELLRDLLAEWIPRCRLIPGNHDHRERIRRVFPELVPQHGPVNFSIEVAGWRLIGLDSLDEGDGEGKGHIDDDQIAWLKKQLTDHGEEPTILFVHHPPFFVQTAWLDRLGLRNRTALIELVHDFPQVRAISAGHVHLEYQAALGQIELLTTPSTAFQFRQYENGPVCDPIPPGFRTFRLDDSSYVTEVIRLPELRFPPSA